MRQKSDLEPQLNLRPIRGHLTPKIYHKLDTENFFIQQFFRKKNSVFRENREKLFFCVWWRKQFDHFLKKGDVFTKN